MSKAEDHEVVSIYPHSPEQIEKMMTLAPECVLNWATKDGWPVGVMHAFVWDKGNVWLTFSSHRHRAAAIKRDPRVSVNISSAGYPKGAPDGLPTGAITFKGRGEFFQDDATKEWFYRALSKKLNPTSKEGEAFFYNLLDSPLRTILAVTPEKMIMYNGGKAGQHMAGTISEDELGERLSGDRERMNEARAKRGLPPR